MFQEPQTKNSADNRSYNGEAEIVNSEKENLVSDIYQLPLRINSEHNRGVDGELSDSSWPPIQQPDPWHKGIEEISVNSNDILAARDNRIAATVHEMWEL